jgi:two-component system NtrC family sensor kinase
MLGLWARPKIAGLAVTWIAAVAVVAVLVALGRIAAVNRGAEDTAALAVVVTQLMERTVQALYLSLGSIADTYEIIEPETDDSEFRGLMQRRLGDIPFARALFIIGPDGRVIHDTDYPTTPRVSLEDRPYFQAYARHGASLPTVWPPLLSRSGTGWFLPVTAMLTGSDAFEGVVVAALQADMFTEELRRTGLGTSHFISLFHDDGSLIASFPPRPDDVGSRFTDLPIFSEGAGEPGAWERVEDDRIVSYRRLDNAPLVVLVSTSMDEVLAGWRGLAAAAMISMLALTTVLVWQVMRLARDHARREQERQRQAQIEKLEALGQLTGGIAHDFSNVLQIVAMNLDVLRSSRDDRATFEQALDSAERAVHNAAAMIERLLRIARRKPLTLSRLKVDEWLATARPLLTQAAGSDVTLEIDVHDGLPDVLCDPDELDVALLNLVVNARHATAPHGCVTIRVYPCDGEQPDLPPVVVSTPPKYVCVAVIDDGCGMTEEVRRRAIEPFFSTKGEAGTGLGLSQVYGLMEQIGGSLSIASSPGIGTAVHLFIPVASSPGPRTEADAA